MLTLQVLYLLWQIRPSVTRRYCVKMTARSVVRSALSGSKMCLVFKKTKNNSQGQPLPPEILTQLHY